MTGPEHAPRHDPPGPAPHHAKDIHLLGTPAAPPLAPAPSPFLPVLFPAPLCALTFYARAVPRRSPPAVAASARAPVPLRCEPHVEGERQPPGGTRCVRRRSPTLPRAGGASPSTSPSKFLPREQLSE
eukprot:4434917-Prymnesium_polylepis.1